MYPSGRVVGEVPRVVSCTYSPFCMEQWAGASVRPSDWLEREIILEPQRKRDDHYHGENGTEDPRGSGDDFACVGEAIEILD